VKEKARASLEDQAKQNLGSSSRYVAESISKKFDNLGGMVSLMEQATLDRFAGYPSDAGYVKQTWLFTLCLARKGIRSHMRPLVWKRCNQISMDA
jgi:hypothetical protein